MSDRTMFPIFNNCSVTDKNLLGDVCRGLYKIFPVNLTWTAKNSEIFLKQYIFFNILINKLNPSYFLFKYPIQIQL